MNSLPILYADSIKYLGFIFTSNNCDDSDNNETNENVVLQI